MFCKQCGFELDKTDVKCPNCNTRAGKGGRFCHNCGAARKTGLDICYKCGISFVEQKASGQTESQQSLDHNTKQSGPKVQSRPAQVEEKTEPALKQAKKPVPKPPVAVQKTVSAPQIESNSLLQKIAAKGSTRNPIVEKLIYGDETNDTANAPPEYKNPEPEIKEEFEQEPEPPTVNNKPKQSEQDKREIKRDKKVEEKQKPVTDIESVEQEPVDLKEPELPPLPDRTSSSEKPAASWADSMGIASLVLAFGCTAQTDFLKFGIMGVLSMILALRGLSGSKKVFAKAAILVDVLLIAITITLQFVG